MDESQALVRLSRFVSVAFLCDGIIDPNHVKNMFRYENINHCFVLNGWSISDIHEKEGKQLIQNIIGCDKLTPAGNLVSEPYCAEMLLIGFISQGIPGTGIDKELIHDCFP